MGWTNVFHCEKDPFCQRVLKHHFPESTPHGDINQTDFTPYADRISVLSGGFPCQPYSIAGKRKGKEDDRHLWPAMLGAIRAIRPRYVVGENVGGIVSWNRGLVFDEVHTDLEAAGYEVQSFILPACGVNAPHRRDRVWFIAYNNNRSEGQTIGTKQKHSECSVYGCAGITANPVSNGQPGKEHGQTERGRFTETGISNDWQNFPTQPPVCGRNDGISSQLAGITVSKWRNESLKAFGNSVVPQVVLQIFKAIQECEIVSFKNPKP